MTSKAEQIVQFASDLTKELTERGMLIEAGFAVFAHYVIPKDASSHQLRDMQLAYMAGAEHLYSSIMNVLDPGEEPTEDDLKRIDLIDREIDQWRIKLHERIHPTQGTA